MNPCLFVPSSFVKPSLFCHGCKSFLPGTRKQFSLSSCNQYRKIQPQLSPFAVFRISTSASLNKYEESKPSVATAQTQETTDVSGSSSEQLLETVAKSMNVTPEQVSKLSQLVDMVESTNKQYNLTAIRTREGIITKHVLDAFTLLPKIDEQQQQQQVKRIIDIGSGAGFPGFVLAITRPDIHITLLDSAKKKTAFHHLVISQLELSNCSSVWSRAEDASSASNEESKLHHREQYCICIARSVARMNELAELTLPFVRVDGLVIAQKTVDNDHAEIKQAHNSILQLGGRIESIQMNIWQSTLGIHENSGTGAIPIGGDDENGHVQQLSKGLVVVRKIKKTKDRFPRKAGVPAKSPLQ